MNVTDTKEYAEQREFVFRTIKAEQATWIDCMHRPNDLEKNAFPQDISKEIEIKTWKQQIDDVIDIVRSLKQWWYDLQKSYGAPPDFVADSDIVIAREAAHAIGKLAEFERRLPNAPSFPRKIVKDLYSEAGLEF